MKDEIKEILDKLKDRKWYDEFNLDKLRKEETHLLLDYIIDLQEENEELKEDLKVYKKLLTNKWEGN